MEGGRSGRSGVRGEGWTKAPCLLSHQASRASPPCPPEAALPIAIDQMIDSWPTPSQPRPELWPLLETRHALCVRNTFPFQGPGLPGQPWRALAKMEETYHRPQLNYKEPWLEGEGRLVGHDSP